MRIAHLIAVATTGLLAACVGQIDNNASCPPDTETFQARVWAPVLSTRCATCHSSSGLAASSDFVLSGTAMPTNLEASSRMASASEAGESLLVLRAIGTNHPGGAVLVAGSAEHAALVAFAGQVRGTAGACDDPALSCAPGDPGPRVLRRLSRAEYDVTLRDVFGVDARYAPALVADVVVHGFDNNSKALVVSPLLAEQLRSAAEEVAATVAAGPDLACNTGDEPACARGFLAGKAARVFRRPLTPAEIERWMAIYQAGRETPAVGMTAHRAGMELVVAGLLQAPSFLYRTELGEPAADGRHALTSYEIASELSYFLWAAPPDDELWQAAERDALRDPAAIATQARRLLASPRARASIDRFTAQWLAIDQLDTVAKDPMTYPELTPSLRKAMGEEARRMVAEVAQGGGTFADLLASDHTWANAELARFYGLPAPGTVDGSGFGRVTSTGRTGLLATGAVLTTHARASSSSPIHRGKLVRERFLCQELPPPPPGLNAQPPAVDPTKTTRERFAQHAADPACSGCHDLMDPVGFAFERFDGIGRRRETEGGRPVDDSGEVRGSVASNGAFSGTGGLAEHLAASNEVQTCFTRQWVRWAYAVEEDAQTACLVDEVGAAFVAGGGSVEDLLVALTQTSHFRFRAN